MVKHGKKKSEKSQLLFKLFASDGLRTGHSLSETIRVCGKAKQRSQGLLLAFSCIDS